jgi:EAL domain-containing protein (putative c-di-GMP-specific phosphodiesterase class I)
VTVSLGLSVYPQDGKDTVALKKHADTAMYRAKRGGRNAMQCFDRSMEEAVSERLDLESALQRAVAARGLKLHYQPQVDRDGTIVCVEALLRWEHPTRGNIPPGAFIPLAEESGLIIPIGAWVLREAARQAREWRTKGLVGLSVAVNVSVLQFVQPDFVDLVRQTIEEFAVPPGGLELELTESLLMKNPDVAAEKLRKLKALGVTLAIDDFGTGYSSLAYLRRLPVDVLKIDRSFVASIGASDRIDNDDRAADEAVVRAITSMSHALRKMVVAEGVETEAQRLFLAAADCDRMQGYLFGRPVAPTELMQKLIDLKPGLRVAG